MDANVFLLKELIDVQIVFELEREELARYYDSESDVDFAHILQRIEDARELKKNYLEILN